MFLVELAKSLSKAKVKYAIVGGYAVALHGAVRGTVDIDIVLSLDFKNFEKCEAVLHNLGLVSRLPISASDIIKFREEYIKRRHLIGWNFHSLKDPTKMVDIIVTHDLDRMKTVTKKVSGVDVVIISIEELIKMKAKSGRPQDLLDVDALTRVKQ